MKNKEVGKYLSGLNLIAKFKLGGQITKGLVKNKTGLTKEAEEIDKFRLDLCDRYCDRDEKDEVIKTYADDGSWSYSFTKENGEIIDKEFTAFLEEENKFEVIKNISAALIDQFSDITLEQTEAMQLFEKVAEEEKPD